MQINHFHLDKVEDILGFAAENTLPGERVKCLVSASYTSDDPEFHHYIGIVNSFFSKVLVSIDSISNFALVIHEDLSADLYINWPLLLELRSKQDINAGDAVMQSSIADIRKVQYQNIDIKSTDKIICCYKVNWKFGLFFDFTRKMDINEIPKIFGNIYRYLAFQFIYDSFTNSSELLQDGWFPFIEINHEYSKLLEIYQNKFEFDNRIAEFIAQFDINKINKLTSKWWQNKIFIDKKDILSAGIKAFLANNKDGDINCIKTLYTEIEGIMRLYHYNIVNKDIKGDKLLEYISEQGINTAGTKYSLLFPQQFIEYLKQYIFSSFDVETSKLDLSRHTTSHGVAKSEDYTRQKALQAILILDQIYYYL